CGQRRPVRRDFLRMTHLAGKGSTSGRNPVALTQPVPARGVRMGWRWTTSGPPPLRGRDLSLQTSGSHGVSRPSTRIRKPARSLVKLHFSFSFFSPGPLESHSTARASDPRREFTLILAPALGPAALAFNAGEIPALVPLPPPGRGQRRAHDRRPA